MRAAKLFGKGDIRVVDCPRPSIGPGEVLVKIGAAAICGSDLRMIANGYRGVDAGHPLTLGHEIAGLIEEVGEGVTGFTPGDRVALAPNIGCGRCEACGRGEGHLCPDYLAFGINNDGGFAEYLRVPSAAVERGNLFLLDQKTPFVEAALIEPASCCLSGQERAGVGLGDSVLVVGAGPIGILHILLARLSGAKNLYIRDISEARMMKCRELVPECISVKGENLTEAIMSLTGGRGVDVCITACPVPAVQAESLALMAKNGRVLFFGGLPAGRDEVPLPTNLIHYRQLAIHGSTGSSVAHYRKTAAFVASGRLPLDGLVSDCFSIDRFTEAVETAKGAQGLKTVITFDL